MSRRVLVVDDNVDSAQMLASFVEMLGYEVQQAHDGQEALERAASFQPEVVLLDIGMPGIDGYEVARRLRADPAFDGTVLAAVTGWNRPEDVERSEAAGFDVHLAKPVDLTLIEDVLASLRPTAPTAAR